MAKFHPKCIFSRGKVNVEQSDVVAVVFRECFAATEGSWLRHVTQRATTRPTVQLVSWQIFLLLWETFLGFFVSGWTGIAFLISKDEVNFMMSPHVPRCVPRHHFQNWQTFVPFCDHHAAVCHPVFEIYNSIQFIIPSYWSHQILASEFLLTLLFNVCSWNMVTGLHRISLKLALFGYTD